MIIRIAMLSALLFLASCTPPERKMLVGFEFVCPAGHQTSSIDNCSKSELRFLLN